MVIYENQKSTGKRIDLMNEKLRDRVAKVKDHAHLKDISTTPDLPRSHTGTTQGC